MAGMNHAQRKYACDRINSIASAARERIVREHTVAAKTLTDSEAHDLLKRGVLKLLDKPSNEWRRGGTLGALFDLSQHEWHQHISKEGVQKMSDLDADKASALDAVMLGDAEEALSVLRSFETKVLN